MSTVKAVGLIQSKGQRDRSCTGALPLGNIWKGQNSQHQIWRRRLHIRQGAVCGYEPYASMVSYLNSASNVLMISPWKTCSNKHCFIWKNFLSKKKREGRKEGGGSLWVQGKGGCPATNMQSTGLSSVDAWTQNEEERSYQESAKPWDSSSNLKYLPLPWHSKLHTTISSTSMRMSPSTKAVSNAPSAVKEKGREFILSCSTRHS